MGVGCDRKKWIIGVSALCCLLASATGSLAKTVQESVREAVMTHPDVQAAYYVYRAAIEERNAAKGGALPKVDLTASAGYEYRNGKAYGNDDDAFFRSGLYLTLTQMLYDGNMVSNRVKKFNYARRAKYYDLRASMEKTALLAFRSHADVVRYTTMLLLARQNLEHHLAIAQKVKKRYKAGLDSKSDLNVVLGRVALARVNLMTEENNLTDASTQYFRTVGESPDCLDAIGVLGVAFPTSLDVAVDQGLDRSPRLSSVFESVFSTFYAMEEQRSKLSPRVDLRLGANLEQGADGVSGHKDKGVAEIIVRYSLYDPSDAHTLRRFAELYKQAEAIYLKTQREVVQSLQVAYSDVLFAEGQLKYLKEHMEASKTTEKAYRAQYEVGRRSLLDVLDSQNEAFQSERAYVNGLYTLENAKAHYLSESGRLVAFFEAEREDVPTMESFVIVHPKQIKEAEKERERLRTIVVPEVGAALGCPMPSTRDATQRLQENAHRPPTIAERFDKLRRSVREEKSKTASGKGEESTSKEYLEELRRTVK